VDSVPDPLLCRKFGNAGNRTQDLWGSSQELWLLDHRSMNDVIYIDQHCIVIDCIHISCILLYNGWIFCMDADMCNNSDMCTLCFWLVPTLVGAFVWWLTHSVSVVWELASNLWLDLPEYNSTIQYNTMVTISPENFCAKLWQITYNMACNLNTSVSKASLKRTLFYGLLVDAVSS
jgi:hypothetical protein